jgi:hypothetical protein
MNKRAVVLLVAATCAFLPFAAHANTGVGFLILSIPVMALGLLPVILIEAPVLSRFLRVSFLRGLWLSFVANAASTILGALIGIAVDIALVVLLKTSFPAVAPVVLVALVPMFFITWWIERKVVVRMQPDAKPLATRATLVANAISYLALAAAVLVFWPEDWTLVRSQLTEVLNAMSVAKLEVSEEFEKRGRFPATLQAPRSKFLRSLTIEPGGRLVAVVSMPDRKGVDGKRIVMEPRVDGRRIAEWKCYTPDLEFKYLPTSCRARGP